MARQPFVHQVVDNTAVRGAKEPAELRTAREALLATNLSHPNIVSTYKIITLSSSSKEEGSVAGGSLNTCTTHVTHLVPDQVPPAKL